MRKRVTLRERMERVKEEEFINNIKERAASYRRTFMIKNKKWNDYDVAVFTHLMLREEL